MSETVLPLGPSGLDLAATLGCGQVFRWSASSDGAWTGVVAGQPVRARVLADRLSCDSDLPPDVLYRYFRLDDDLPSVYASFPPDPELLDAVQQYRGMRLIRQDPWECLISFLCAQNANIPRIRGMIESLCTAWGDRLENGLRAFPEPHALAAASTEDVQALGLGYRSGWVVEAARAVSEGGLGLQAMAQLDTPTLLERLLGVAGVGPKVAACIALFSYGRLDVVPIDVWITRVIAARCPEARSYRSRAEYARRWLGPNAGYAQQYLFHHIRALAGVPCAQGVRVRVTESEAASTPG